MNIINVGDVKPGDRITGSIIWNAVVKVKEVKYEENKPYAPYFSVKGVVEDDSKVTYQRAKDSWEKDGFYYSECSPEVRFEKL